MAKTEQYTAAQMIEAIRATKGLISLAAKKLSCHPTTIRSYVARYPTVAEALKEEREAMTDTAELALFNAIQAKHAWAVCFYLKTQGKNRGYVERLETSNQNWDMSMFSDEELDRIAEGADPSQVVKDRKP